MAGSIREGQRSGEEPQDSKDGEKDLNQLPPSPADFARSFLIKELKRGTYTTPYELIEASRYDGDTILDAIFGASHVGEREAKALANVFGLGKEWWLERQRLYDEATFQHDRPEHSRIPRADGGQDDVSDTSLYEPGAVD